MGEPVIVLGGVGFIGRNLVKYLVDNNLASKIKVIDKALPSTSYFAAETQKAFADPRVEVKQANLARKDTLEAAFKETKYTYVFNCAGETKPNSGGSEDIFKEKILDVTKVCAEVAAAHKAKFLHISTGQVYEPHNKPVKEDGKLKPWTTIAKYHLQAEEALRAIPGLNYGVLRAAIVYGPGDTTGIAPRLIAAATYVQMKTKMELLWDKDMKINTVHVRDVCKALWVLAGKGQSGAVYNVCDKNHTDQGIVNKHIEAIFKIKTGFHGTILSSAAKMNLEGVVETANEKHLAPWSAICKEHHITNTPLTPYLDVELMSNNPLSLDGNKIEADLGFTYDHPTMSEADIRGIVNYYLEQKLFPPIIS